MRRRLPQAAAQFLIACCLLWALMTWLDGKHHLLYIWPMTAVQLALVLSRWRDRRLRFMLLVAGTAGELTGCLLLRMPLPVAVGMSLVQGAEVWAAGVTLSRFVTRFDDLKRRVQVWRFGLVAIAVPAVFDSVGAITAADLTHRTLLDSWMTVATSDALGLAVLLPPLLFLLTGEYRNFRKLRPHLVASAPALLLFVLMTIAIFAQTSNPFLFLVFPPLILVVFSLGLEGAVIALPVLTLVACTATANHSGPVWLKADSTMEHRIFVLQVFLCTTAAVALAVGALLDERRRAERSAKEGQSIYETLIQNAEDMIILYSFDGRRRFVSPAVTKMIGWSQEEFIALRKLEGIHPADRDLARTILASLTGGKMNHTFRYRAVCRDGQFRWVEAFVRGYRDSESSDVAGYVATVRDISQQKETEESWQAERAAMAQQNDRLADLAAQDELTGIPNRRAFNRALENEAARHARSDKPLALLMLDVDYFKKFNDRYGHPEGDLCLRRLAQSLQACTRRAGDLTARVGGEEFAVLLPATNEAGAIKLAEKMIRAVRNLDIKHEDSPLGRVSISVGVSIWPPRFTTEPTQLIQQADRALYESKSRGRNCVTVAEERVAISATGKYFEQG